MLVKSLPVSTLRPSPENPRVIDQQAVDVVARSIRDYGFRVPLVVSPDSAVVCGHVRLRAAQHIGLLEVPCVVADGLNQAQLRALMLVENRVNELAGAWDAAALRPLAAQLGVLDWFDDFDFPAPDGPLVVEPDAEEPPHQHDEQVAGDDDVVQFVVRVRRSKFSEARRAIVKALGRDACTLERT